MVGAIVVQFYLHVWFREFSLTRQQELYVFDIEPPCYPHLLVVGLDGEELGVES